MSEPTVVKNCYACPFCSDWRCDAPFRVVGCDGKSPDMYDATIENERGLPLCYNEEDSPPHPHCPMQGRTIALAWPPAGGGA